MEFAVKAIILFERKVGPMAEYLKLKKSNCVNCYKCIRHCPVKSIKYSTGQAQIVSDECILCGQCFVVCPQNAKEIRNDVPSAIELIKRGPVYASVAPSFVANYPGATISTMEKALKQVFGYDSFRPGQATLAESLLQGRDALGVMPTGAGKSICFQIPGILLPAVRNTAILIGNPLVVIGDEEQPIGSRLDHIADRLGLNEIQYGDFVGDFSHHAHQCNSRTMRLHVSTFHLEAENRHKHFLRG